MRTTWKPLTFLLALTFLFLFSGSVYGQEEVEKKYWDNGKLQSEKHYSHLTPTLAAKQLAGKQFPDRP